jgi:hypothetical protein
MWHKDGGQGIESRAAYVGSFAESVEVEDPEEEEESRQQEDAQEQVLEAGHVRGGDPPPWPSECFCQ